MSHAARPNIPRVSLPRARQLAYEGANSRLERRFAGKDHPLRIRKGQSIGHSHQEIAPNALCPGSYQT